MITLKTTKGICCRLTSIKVPQSGVHIQNVAVTTDSSCTLTANSNASKVYHTLYPWKTLNEFAQHLYDRIVFNDGRLIAIDKPWGVGTYLAHSRTTKDTQYTLSQVPGRPRYSVNDALPSLCEKLKLDQLHVIRSLDRQTSGLMLLSHDPTLKDAIKRSINRSKVTVKPHLTFECITSGYPSTQQVKEKVAIVKEKETKQTSSSEPVIRPKSAAHRGADAYTVQVEMNVLATNQQLAVSHLQLNVNTTRWHFLRIYVTTVCSFILGDIRFSARFGRTIGQKLLLPVSVTNNDLEPLSHIVGQTLHVRSNRAIPLMLHLAEIRLPDFNRKGEILTLKTRHLPPHFAWTLQQLQLCNNNSRPMD